MYMCGDAVSDHSWFFKEEVSTYQKTCKDSFESAEQNPVYKLESWLGSPWEGEEEFEE